MTEAVPGVALAGQPLIATAALSRAALVSGSVSGVVLAGLPLTVEQLHYRGPRLLLCLSLWLY